MAEAKKVWRKDPTAPHPLYDGNPGLYWSDSRWREDIPRAGAGTVGVRTPGLFSSSDKLPGYYKFGK